jgi:hypothetical protein
MSFADDLVSFVSPRLSLCCLASSARKKGLGHSLLNDRYGRVVRIQSGLIDALGHLRPVKQTL